MKPHDKSRAGFTLIETAAVLSLTALGLVFAAMLLVTSMNVFISNVEAAEDSQKIQVAMNRLVKELTFAGAGTVVITNGRMVQWTSVHPDRFGEGTQTVSWDGNSGSNLLLQGAPLLNEVGVFTVSSTADTVTLMVGSARSPGVTHTTTVHPRYDL